MNKLISIISTCLLASVVCADPVTVPNTFSAGTPAKASEVNANFTALANAVNANAPLMVYDSTGKLLGRYLGTSISPDRLYVSSYALIKIPEATFITAVDDVSIDPISPNIQSGSQSNLIGRSVYFKSGDCSGQGYVQQVALILGLFSGIDYAVVNHDSGWIIFTKLRTDWIFGESFTAKSSLGMDHACNKSPDPNYSYVTSMIPVTKLLDMAVLDFTPPFSVH